jgi:hypothetical protein
MCYPRFDLAIEELQRHRNGVYAEESYDDGDDLPPYNGVSDMHRTRRTLKRTESLMIITFLFTQGVRQVRIDLWRRQLRK